jgi:hypothetical protein
MHGDAFPLFLLQPAVQRCEESGASGRNPLRSNMLEQPARPRGVVQWGVLATSQDAQGQRVGRVRLSIRLKWHERRTRLLRRFFANQTSVG